MMLPNAEIAVLLLIPTTTTPVSERELGRGVGGDPRSPFAVVREGMLRLCLLGAAAFSLLLGRCCFPPFQARRRPAFKHLQHYRSETSSLWGADVG